MLITKVKELKDLHNQDFMDKVRIVKEYGFYNEFLDATREEEHGLQKVIEAYDKRVGQSKHPVR